MALFALMRDPQTPVLRFHLNAELERQVAAAFEEQYRVFRNGIVEAIAFDGRNTPEADELLVIENLVDPYGLAAAIANPLTIDTLDPNLVPLDNIKGVFWGLTQGQQTHILFQVFEKKRVIARAGPAMFYSNDTFRPVSGAGLTLDHRLTAVLDGTSLTFRNFFFARQLFDLQAYLKEATDEQVVQFAEHEKISVADADLFKANASSTIRKRIAVILDSGILDRYPSDRILEYAQHYDVQLEIDGDGKIVMPTDKKVLKELLDVLDEGYFTSTLSNQRYKSRGKLRIG